MTTTSGDHRACGRCRCARWSCWGRLTAAAPLVTDFYLPGAARPGALTRHHRGGRPADRLGLDRRPGAGPARRGPAQRPDRPARYRCGPGCCCWRSRRSCAPWPRTSTVLLGAPARAGAGRAATLVVARAVVRDVYDGARAARIFSELILVMGLAPVVGPMVGGQLLQGDRLARHLRHARPHQRPSCSWRRWRCSRRPGTPRAAGSPSGFGAPSARSGLPSASCVVAGCLGVVLFSYISMSPFVLREEYGIGPVGVLLDLRRQCRPGWSSAGRSTRDWSAGTGRPSCCASVWCVLATAACCLALALALGSLPGRRCWCRCGSCCAAWA